MAARLVLEDGSQYVGTLFGAAKSVPGEVGELNILADRPSASRRVAYTAHCMEVTASAAPSSSCGGLRAVLQWCSHAHVQFLLC